MLWRRKRKAQRQERPVAEDAPDQPELAESGAESAAEAAPSDADMTAAFVEAETLPGEAEAAPPDTAAEAPGPQGDAPAAADAQETDDGTGKRRWLSRLKGGLSRSSSKVGGGIGSIFSKRKLDDESLEDLEDLLISADLGVDTASRLTQQLGERRFDKEVDPETVRTTLRKGGSIIPERRWPRISPRSSNRWHSR